jgi:hypothetical protein
VQPGDVETQDIWNSCTALIKSAQASEDFQQNHRAQVELVNKVAAVYNLTVPDKQQFLRANCMPLIPRILEAKNQQPTFEALMDLANPMSPWSPEDISRALKVRANHYQEWQPDPGEDIYPKHGWIGAYMNWCKSNEVPLGYYFWSAVSAIGAACRYNFYIGRITFKLRMNHYIIMVGSRAVGKSQALNAATEVLRRANLIMEPDDTKPNPFRIRRLPEDTNVETLTRRLEWQRASITDANDKEIDVGIDSTGLLALDELTTFLGKDNWALSKRVPWLTTVYGRDIYEYETKSGGHILCKNLALSLLACTAPDWMNEAITPLLFSGGFSDRTIYVYRENSGRNYPTPAPMDPLVAIELAEGLAKLSQHYEPVEMVATPDAEEWYDWWYDQQPHSSEESGMSRHRKSNHVWKLAAILAISAGDAPWISIKHFASAVDYIDNEELYFAEFHKAIHKAPEDDHHMYILKTLRKWGGEASQSRLFNLLRQRKGLSPPNIKARPYLSALEQMGKLVQEKGEKGGIVYKLTKEGWSNE